MGKAVKIKRVYELELGDVFWYAGIERTVCKVTDEEISSKTERGNNNLLHLPGRSKMKVEFIRNDEDKFHKEDESLK